MLESPLNLSATTHGRAWEDIFIWTGRRESNCIIFCLLYEYSCNADIHFQYTYSLKCMRLCSLPLGCLRLTWERWAWVCVWPWSCEPQAIKKCSITCPNDTDMWRLSRIWCKVKTWVGRRRVVTGLLQWACTVGLCVFLRKQVAAERVTHSVTCRSDCTTIASIFTTMYSPSGYVRIYVCHFSHVRNTCEHFVCLLDVVIFAPSGSVCLLFHTVNHRTSLRVCRVVLVAGRMEVYRTAHMFSFLLLLAKVLLSHT